MTSPRISAAPPYQTIVFDCDSTLSRIEGIEELAKELASDWSPRIQELTRAAMAGEIPLEEVYGQRLKSMRPSAASMARVAQLYWEERLPRTRNLIQALLFLGKDLRVVSGGLLPCVQPFALRLGFLEENIHAVETRCDDQGQWLGFDQESPLARSGGKLEMLGAWHAAGAAPLALVGDGATDLEAAPVCARFVAFMGVAQRDAVAQAADRVCSEADMAALLPLLVSKDELATLEQHAEHGALVARARELQP
ncbi:MAG TPA: haloacid dehalogenase [Planctomycetes bacterium]|nr:haloacid dehalogenase [Planctomycetota bacterium]